jgi:hypothetical protein
MAKKSVYARYKTRRKRQQKIMSTPEYKKKIKFLKKMAAEAKLSGVKPSTIRKKKSCGCGRKKR